MYLASGQARPATADRPGTPDRHPSAAVCSGEGALDGSHPRAAAQDAASDPAVRPEREVKAASTQPAGEAPPTLASLPQAQAGEEQPAADSSLAEKDPSRIGVEQGQAADTPPQAGGEPPQVGGEPSQAGEALAQPAPSTQAEAAQPAAEQAEKPAGLIPLQPQGNIWLDPQKKRVVLVGKICLREGQLEMFACPEGTKEHESIISVPVKAYVIHAALLALGAKPGSPTVFVPEFRPASGTRVDVSIYWTDEHGQRRSAWAQDWVRHWRTGLPMQEHWVFAGSSFWVNEQTGEKYYQAEEGFLICLANFSTAMLDIPVESSDAAGQLVFEAFTERIPPLGKRVTLVLTPRLDESPEAQPVTPEN